MTDKIAPTQADIAAAKPIAVRIMIGELTHDELVEAFAKHAAAAIAQRDVVIAELTGAFGDLLKTHDEDAGMDEFDDGDSVGAFQDDAGQVHDLPLTFGVLRRARAALAKAQVKS